ncbi:unnamed protein product [Tuber melanosporum]|uniref:(Perigord truffle) hypothetical protein n=1 Tax=Tuber melanosporum (strain Mel28) TaxID=656061 RepID=D5G811_TUBMM|nr:uncharacterized protein GSTUM_00002778001 [Tuber melanosporum]CAZ80654.1 unnamed protein product [Tuber melanosporum]
MTKFARLGLDRKLLLYTPVKGLWVKAVTRDILLLLLLLPLLLPSARRIWEGRGWRGGGLTPPCWTEVGSCELGQIVEVFLFQ